MSDSDDGPRVRRKKKARLAQDRAFERELGLKKGGLVDYSKASLKTFTHSPLSKIATYAPTRTYVKQI